MQSPIVGWREGAVDASGGCLGIQYGLPAGEASRDWIPVALVGAPEAGTATVEFLVPRGSVPFADAISAVEDEIEFYLVDKGEPDAWGYMCGHHTSQLANEYGPVQWGYFPTRLAAEAFRFRAAMRSLVGVRARTLSVEALRKDPNWNDWGKQRGVYCFTDGHGQVAYIGRSLGKTLGERIWVHLRDFSPDWVAATSGPDAQITILPVDDDQAFVSSALEAFLISRLEPTINRNCQ